MRSLTIPRYFTAVVGFAVILLSLGCSDEPIDNIRHTSPPPGSTDAPSTMYFPMSTGNRWVYRNPDGSEWIREVTETAYYGDNLYHYFISLPQLQDTQIESLRSPVYVAFLNRLDRKLLGNDLGATIREIIVDSGGETPNWSVGMRCSKRGREKAVCVTRKDGSAQGILTYLYRYNTNVTSHGNLTLFPLPLVPGKSYNALNLSLRGEDRDPFYIHEFEAEVVVLGKVSDFRKSVDVPFHTFEDCFRIQYEAEMTSFRTVAFHEFGEIAMIEPKAYVKALESEIREELTDLLTHIMAELELQTMWLAAGVGPVKIETPNGIAELVDYEIKTVDLYRTR